VREIGAQGDCGDTRGQAAGAHHCHGEFIDGLQVERTLIANRSVFGSIRRTRGRAACLIRRLLNRRLHY
jgi:hypothetical protein